jgi:hypothetical protein
MNSRKGQYALLTAMNTAHAFSLCSGEDSDMVYQSNLAVPKGNSHSADCPTGVWIHPSLRLNLAEPGKFLLTGPCPGVIRRAFDLFPFAANV